MFRDEKTMVFEGDVFDGLSWAAECGHCLLETP